MNDRDEIDQELLIESHEHLHLLGQDPIPLEQSPARRDLLGSVFRTIHTIEGTSESTDAMRETAREAGAMLLVAEPFTADTSVAPLTGVLAA